MPVTLRICVATVLLGGLTAGGVSCRGSDAPKSNDRDAMETVDLKLNGQAFRVWVARTDEERNQGLMNVTAADLAPLPDGTERGMLFVFSDEALRAFWMKDTITPLDIAYLTTDGTIVKTYTMPPLVTRTFPSVEPARFALEMNAGRLDGLGLFEQDRPFGGIELRGQFGDSIVAQRGEVVAALGVEPAVAGFHGCSLPVRLECAGSGPTAF